VAAVEVEIPARSDYLELVRLVVATAAAIDPRFRDERIDDLLIAVSEATTNAIEASTAAGRTAGAVPGAGAGDPRVHVRCLLADDRIEVEVRDRGGGFDPGELAPIPEAADPDRLQRERGLGLPLMRTLADEAVVTNAGGGTEVRLVVYTRR
jgi:anti-sigma regulatory factor (Ser/Thr protein kinase)